MKDTYRLRTERGCAGKELRRLVRNMRSDLLCIVTVVVLSLLTQAQTALVFTITTIACPG